MKCRRWAFRHGRTHRRSRSDYLPGRDRRMIRPGSRPNHARRPARPDPPDDAHSSLCLLQQAQAGDQDALNRLVARYLPRLKRWAAGRLPVWARDLSDTQDLVQETLVRAFQED